MADSEIRMSLRKRLAVSAFLVLGGGLGVWFWQSNTGLIPPSSEKPSAGTSTDVPDRGRSVSAAGPEGAQGNRTEARSPVVSPAAPQEPVPEWLSGATLLSGGLSAAEVAVARSYVGPLMESAAAELDALKVDSESGEDLAEQARIIRDLELWRAVDLSLRRGSFRVAKSVPADLQAPSGVQLQLLPTWKDEKSVSLVFAFKRSEESGLFDANSYEAQMEAFRDRDAAWRFNQLSYEPRKRKLAHYKRLLTESDWQELPAQMRRDFPLRTIVEEGSLLMKVAR